MFSPRDHIHLCLHPELVPSKEVTVPRSGLGKGCWEMVLGTVNNEFSFAFLTVEFALSPVPSLQLHLIPLSSGNQARGTQVSAPFSVWSL